MGPLEQNLGFILMGVIFNTYLFGLVSGQFVTYYTSAAKDPLWIRIMVHSMVLTDSFHSIALVYLAWVYCVEDFAHPEKVQYAVWPYATTPIANEIAAIVTQIFLGYRIFCWTRSWLLFGFISAGALAAFILGCIVSVNAYSVSTLAKMSNTSERTFATVWISLQVITDLLILVILVTLFFAARTTSRQTNMVISRLTRAAIQTSAFGAIFAFAIMITFLVFPQSTLYSFFGFAVPRLYTNTMMYTLNMREELRDVLNYQSDTFSLSNIRSHSREPTFGTGVLVFQASSTSQSTMPTGNTGLISSGEK